MANWLKDRKIPTSQNADPAMVVKDKDHLIQVLRTITSTDQCLDLFHSLGLLDGKGLSADTANLLYKVCGKMRTQGLGLEPNLIGQTTAKAILDRHLAGTVSIRLASADSDFCDLITQADAARDAGELGLAQHRYWQALQLFPAHPGYRIQYAHCLKDQGLMKDALLEYIDAFYFGATKKDIEPHALFTANAIGRYDAMNTVLNRQQSGTHTEDSLNWFITSTDVITLHIFLLGYGPSKDDIIGYIFLCDSRRSLLYALLDHKDFVNTHRDTLRLLVETGWRLK